MATQITYENLLYDPEEILQRFDDECINILYDQLNIDLFSYSNVLNFLNRQPRNLGREELFDFIIQNNEYDNIHSLLKLYISDSFGRISIRIGSRGSSYKIAEFIRQLEKFYYKIMIRLLP